MPTTDLSKSTNELLERVRHYQHLMWDIDGYKLRIHNIGGSDLNEWEIISPEAVMYMPDHLASIMRHYFTDGYAELNLAEYLISLFGPSIPCRTLLHEVIDLGFNIKP